MAILTLNSASTLEDRTIEAGAYLRSFSVIIVAGTGTVTIRAAKDGTPSVVEEVISADKHVVLRATDAIYTFEITGNSVVYV